MSAVRHWVWGLSLLLAVGGATAQPLSAAMQAQELAARLALWGDRERDALALMTAVQLSLNSGARPSAAAARAQLMSPGSRSDSVPALLARARNYAANRPDLLAIIADLETGSRGAQQGPFRERVLAPVGAVQSLVVTFLQGAKATFGIAGEGDTDLELEIVDERGQQVCADRSRGDRKHCTWTPKATSEYRVKVRNLGQRANEFAFFHN
jgi:hypothetical protein